MHCLRIAEYEYFIDYHINNLNKIYNDDIDEELIKQLLSQSETWETELVGVNYILSIILERLLKKEVELESILDQVYNLQERIYFQIQEIDYSFIKKLYMGDLPLEKSYQDIIEECQYSLYE
ncbi:MAG: hypothetical protein AAF849_11525 [Bacteroidota bacterium]